MQTNNLLLYKIKKGDTESFAKVWDSYHEKIYRFIYLKVPTRQDAEDIAGETFLRFWHYLREGKQVESIQALLYKTARNLVVDFYRKRGKPTESFEDLVIEEIIVADRVDLSLEEKMTLKSNFEAIEETLRQLKDIYREVIVLHYLNELSVTEVSQIINRSRGATRVLLHRGVKTLKELLEEKKGEDKKTKKSWFQKFSNKK